MSPVLSRTIPQLELCAALLLTTIVESTRKTLGIPLEAVTAWGDSTVVLCWLNKGPYEYETFVANRITSVISSIPASQWKHVPSAENPADCASRGISAEELKHHNLWWNGPPWLLQDPVEKPEQPSEEEIDRHKNENRRAVPKVFNKAKDRNLEARCLVLCSAPAEWLVVRSMSFRTLIHVAGWLTRAVYNFMAPIRHHQRNTDLLLTVEEVKAAKLLLLKRAQRRSYNLEITGLTATPPHPIPATSKLLKVKPFLSEEGLLRVGGRLVNSELSYSQRHPVLLSARDPLAKVIFLSQHEKLCHCGTTLLLSSIGEEYYVKGAKRLAQNVCQGCVICKKVSATTAL